MPGKGIDVRHTIGQKKRRSEGDVQETCVERQRLCLGRLCLLSGAETARVSGAARACKRRGETTHERANWSWWTLYELRESEKEGEMSTGSVSIIEKAGAVGDGGCEGPSGRRIRGGGREGQIGRDYWTGIISGRPSIAVLASVVS